MHSVVYAPNHAPAGWDYDEKGQAYPRVWAEAEDGQTRFWCPWCDRTHLHGANSDGSFAGGHRVSHCIAQGSPYRATGYFLVEGEAGCSKPPPRRERRAVWYDLGGNPISGWVPRPKPVGRRQILRELATVGGR